MSKPSITTEAILEALRSAVAEELDKKRRLGHYAVIWKDGRPHILQPTDPPPASRDEAAPDLDLLRKTQD